MARQPDEALDRLLTRKLRSYAAGDVACPSAEVIAAYLERVLDSEEARRIEVHMASCARCAETLALLVETEPVAPAPTAAWWSWRTWRWVVPATAVLVVGIWFASTLPGERTAAPQMAQYKEAPEPSLDEAAPIAIPPAATTAPANSRARPGSLPEAKPADAAPEVPTASLQARQAQSQPRGAAEQQTSNVRERDALAADAIAPSTPPAEPASEQPRGFAKSEESRADAPTRDARRESEKAVAGATAPASSTLQQSAQATQARAQQRSAAFAPLVLRARTGNMWRISGSVIERSGDGGATWAMEFSASDTVSAGVVAADDTVWLVGSGGLVLRRPAAGWRAVSAPVMVDLVGVSDAGATSVTVRTADGRQFRTTDGGVTWMVR